MSGKFGSADLAAGVETVIYTVPNNTVATSSLTIVNRGPDAALIRVAIYSGANSSAADFIEYDAMLPVGGVLERTGIVLSAGEKLAVQSDVANVTARAHGFEQGA